MREQLPYSYIAKVTVQTKLGCHSERSEESHILKPKILHLRFRMTRATALIIVSKQ